MNNIPKIKTESSGYPANLEQQASFLNKVFFFWTNKVVSRGQNYCVKETDLYDLNEDERLKFVLDLVNQSKAKYPNKGLSFHIFNTCKLNFLLLSFYSIAVTALSFAGPIFLSLIIKNIADPTSKEWKGYLYASLLFFFFLLKAFFGQHLNHVSSKVTYQIANQILGGMYQKLLNLSNSGKKYMDPGKMTNLVIMNSLEVLQFFLFFFMAMTAPLTILAASGYIIYELGAIGLIAPFLLICSSVIVHKIQDKQTDYRRRVFVIIDNRCKQITEYFQGIKIIKYYAWEEWVLKVLEKVRQSEIKLIFDYLFNIGSVECISNVAPSIIAVLVFIFYILQGNTLSAATAYTVLSLIGMLQSPIIQIISGWSKYNQCKVSYSRILHFLSAEERDSSYQDEELIKSLPIGEIKIVNGFFSWESPINETHNLENPDISHEKAAEKEKLQKQIQSKSAKQESTKDLEATLKSIQEKEDSAKKISATLSEINLNLKAGTFNGVYGLFSSGKSTLAHCIINELYKLSGKIAVKGTIAYIPQIPWLRSCSLKENIVFGESFDQKRYKKVLRICELNDDIAQLQGGDMTEIGERGVNLSGGQKQRISIARAVYSNRDIFVVDDCLSALDSHVGKQIFSNVFQKYLKGKTIVFVTHHMHLMPHFNTITIMKSGRIQDHGTYQSLVDSNSDALAFLKNEQKKENVEIADQELEGDEKDDQEEIKIMCSESNNKIPRKYTHQLENCDERSSLQDEQQSNGNNEDKIEKGALTQNEEKAVGSVPFYVYKEYFKMGGYGYILLALVVYAIAQTALMQITVILEFKPNYFLNYRLSDWWLGQWSAVQYSDLEDKDYAGIYAGLSLLGGLLYLLRYFAFLLFSLSVSKKVFMSMLERLLHSPMSFFDTTPLGRIVSRFTKDIDSVDYYLQMIIQQLIGGFMTVIGSFVMISMITPIFIAVCGGLFILYYFVLRRNIRCSREIKRILDNIRAPLIGVYTELNQGLIQIRSQQKQEYFFKTFSKCVDAHTRASFNTFFCDRWLGLITDIFSTIIIAAAAYLGLAQKSVNKGDYHLAALIGLSISWALKISFSLPTTIRFVADTELQMNSFHRILNYIEETPQEREYIMKNEENKQEQAKWPINSTVDIKNISYRYRDDTPIILKNISLSIKSNEKIGVVGRTGSGKSTLTLGLLRILELVDEEKGSITLDGKNISKMGLKKLRNNISMIPQDPVLFQGTIRTNVDPFHQFSNKEVVNALQKVQLWEPLLIRAKESIKTIGDKIQTVQNTNENILGESQPLGKSELQESTINCVLDIAVENGGSNFSQGEKQLIALSRVIVRKCKILLMDEATASIDEKTDWIIQDMVRSYFAETSIITIAHRLKTIIQYDKILVLGEGEVKEFDSPKAMLSNNNSYLLKLIKEQGKEHEEEMKKLAFS